MDSAAKLVLSKLLVFQFCTHAKMFTYLPHVMALKFLCLRTVGYEKHPELLTYCEYLSELSLYEYELLHIPPSQISAAIVLLTRVSFEEVPTFPEALRAHSQCTYDEVLPIAQKLVETLTKFQRGAGRSGKRLYVVEKFDSARRHRVSRRAVPVF